MESLVITALDQMCPRAQLCASTSLGCPCLSPGEREENICRKTTLVKSTGCCLGKPPGWELVGEADVSEKH